MISNTGWYRNVVTGTGQRATYYSSKAWVNNDLQFVRGTRNNARTKRMATHVSRGHSTLRFGGGPALFCVSAFAVQGFVHSWGADVLQARHTPQKMMPRNGTSLVASVHFSISQHQTVHAMPV